MKFVEVTKLYPKYLNYIYEKNPNYLRLPYDKHLLSILEDCNAESNFLLQELEKFGYETEMFYFNAVQLQKSYDEDLSNYSLFEIIKCQLKKSKPDILFISDLFCFNEIQLKILKAEMPSSTKFVAWHFGVVNDFSKKNARYFDQIYTGSKYMVKTLSKYNNNVKLLYHCFSPMILEKIKKQQKSNIVVFPGSISLDCQFSRLEMCGSIIEAGIPLIFAGEIYGTLNPTTIRKILGYYKLRLKNKVPHSSRYKEYERKLRQNMVSSKFGMEYYQFIADNLVCINKHADISGTGSGNMRMTEVTGIGTCLLTDFKEENKDLFEPDYEIVEYKNTEELIEKAKWLIANPKKAMEIASAGQRKTLNSFTYKQKAQQIIEYFKDL